MRCGAKTKSGKPCRHFAGMRTDHPGEGRCWLHGGATPIKHGRYSKITRPRIRELIDHYETDPVPNDLLPEVNLLRALVTDFVERYDEITDAVLAWHSSWGEEYRKAVHLWREKMLRRLEGSGWQDVDPDELPDPPDPLDFMNKPRQMLDVTAAAGMVDKVGAMVDRIQKHRREGAITLDTLNRVLEQLGVEVVHAVAEVITDAATRAQVLNAVERRWGTVHVDTLATSRAGPQVSDRRLN